MQRIFFLTLLLLNFLLASSFAVTEFICNINGGSVEDYNSITLWEAAIDDAGDLTDGTVVTGDWDAQTGTIADATAVTWNGGSESGTLIIMTDAGSTGTYLLDQGTDSLVDNDIIDDGSGNTITVKGAPDSALLVGEFYNDNGVLTESAVVVFSGNTSNATSHIVLRVPSGERHDGTVAGGGAEVRWNSASDGLRVADNNYIKFQWLVIGMNAGNNYGAIDCDSTDNSHVFIENNIIYKQTNEIGRAHV